MNEFNQLIEFQLSVSTADDEKAYFTGNEGVAIGSATENSLSLPAGTYRLIEGALYRIVPGIPPTMRGKNSMTE